MTTPAPLAIGAHRDFPAGRVVVSVTRTDADTFRVVVLDLRGHAIPCYTRTFDATTGDLPMDMSVRRATWTYMQCLARDFDAGLETPAGIAQRSHALAA